MVKCEWLSMLMVGVAASVAGCASPSGDDVDQAAGAQSSDPTGAAHFATGEYGEGPGVDLQLLVDGGRVSGRVHTTVGDPANGGATCSFAFAGNIADDHAQVQTVNGAETQPALLSTTTRGGLILQFKDEAGANAGADLAGCSRIWGHGNPIELAKVGELAAKGIRGWAAVQASKAHFHDESHAARAAYVVSGDVVTLKQVELDTTEPSSDEGWALVDFTNDEGRTTSGWLKLAELVIPQ